MLHAASRTFAVSSAEEFYVAIKGVIPSSFAVVGLVAFGNFGEQALECDRLRPAMCRLQSRLCERTSLATRSTTSASLWVQPALDLLYTSRRLISMGLTMKCCRHELIDQHYIKFRSSIRRAIYGGAANNSADSMRGHAGSTEHAETETQTENTGR